MLEAFLCEIVDHPEDDVPRLVLADWLDDQGDPASAGCAEFIRVQCRLDGMALDDLARPELEARELALWSGYPQRWATPLRGRVRDWTFRRGLVGGVSLSAGQLLTHHAELFDLAPVQGLHLYDLSPLAAATAPMPELARIRELHFGQASGGWSPGSWGYNQAHVRAIRALLLSPYLTQVRRLTIHLGRQGEELVGLLDTWPGLAGLEALDLRNNRLAGPQLEAILSPDRLPHLRELRLGSLGPLSGYHRRPSPHLRSVAAILPNLEVLELAQFMPAEVVHLLTTSPSPRLRVLALSYLSHPPTSELLASTPALANLVCLRLDHAGFSPAVAMALATSPHLTRLRYLEVRGYTVDSVQPERAVDFLAGATGLTSLIGLSLQSQRLDAQGLRALLGAPFLEQLHTLDLTDSWFLAEDEAAGVLLTRGPWPRLVRLDVRWPIRLSQPMQQSLRERFGERIRYAKPSGPGVGPLSRP